MEQQFIPCTEKHIAPELRLAAAANAIDENPVNRPRIERLALLMDVELTPGHMALATSKFWRAGTKLGVWFMDSAPLDLQKKILSYANLWNKTADIEFYLTTTDPMIRVMRDRMEFWSFLGSDLKLIARNQPTMMLGGFTMQTRESEFERVVTHEFGHSIGAVHEHMRPEIVARINPEKAIRYFAETQGWSAAQTMQQVLKPLSESSLTGTARASQTSIMCYSLPGEITYDGQPIIGGTKITDEDYEFMGKALPKSKPPTPPSPPPNPPAPPQPANLGQAAFTINMDAKTATVTLPSGWIAKKASSTVDEL